MSRVIFKEKTPIRLHAAPVLIGLVVLTVVLLFTT